ncbi:cAMP-dependent protein kinase regulatory subunit [Symbiodinium microadriaticum]|uniref:cAMP-dependent protein kinase regulatory subunit n=1 Tax=Symbiodinium microadriaticum TaxID=2951 RepID=A0A1Q9E6S7_SYMMI|nr:cAMP-dependent protein kinase regulatory subunit [Symbiodinium microadriaticum]
MNASCWSNGYPWTEGFSCQEPDRSCCRSWPYVEEVQIESDRSDLGAFASGATSGDDLALPVVPPPASAHLTNRRGGVSAEPAGANNVRWAEWTAPFYRKSEEHRIKLLCAVRTCPIFQGVEERDLHTIVDAIEVVSFQPRDTIYTKGEYGRSGFVLISGQVIAEAEDVDQSDNIFRRSKSRWVTFEEGQFFGEHTMLWGFTRRVTMTTSEGCVVGKLRRDAYFNIVTRSAMRTRSLKEKYLRQVPIFETFDDELIIRITDIVEKRTYAQGQKIIKQGEEIVQAGQSVSKGENVPAELYILLSGQCEASIMVDVVGGNKKEAEEQAVREYKPGQRFGELGFIHRKTRAANVTAKTEVELLVLDRDTFERLVELELKQRENYACDPRKALADFWSPGSRRGPRGIEAPGPSSETHWFAVYRPTSRDALAKMLNQTAVGKGLNVKGKSAKRNRLSGFVPFLQIHDNADKNKIENPPPDAFVTIYYDTKPDREIALQEMRDAAAIGGAWTGDDRDHAITLDDSYPDAFGARVPETLMRMVYIDKQDIQFQAGWETGRHSEPAFMDMNLHAVRDEKSNPRVVLYQYDATNPMNPHGLLIAYAEEWTTPHSSKVVRTVKPVVSDFDTFTVGSKGMRYERLPPDQMELELWSLDRTREILNQPNSDSWTSRWLKVLSEAAKQGRRPEIPPLEPSKVSIRGTEHASDDADNARRVGANSHSTLLLMLMISFRVGRLAKRAADVCRLGLNAEEAAHDARSAWVGKGTAANAVLRRAWAGRGTQSTPPGLVRGVKHPAAETPDACSTWAEWRTIGLSRLLLLFTEHGQGFTPQFMLIVT